VGPAVSAAEGAADGEAVGAAMGAAVGSRCWVGDPVVQLWEMRTIVWRGCWDAAAGLTVGAAEQAAECSPPIDPVDRPVAAEKV
jgi:hypothetical protein